MSWEDVLKKPRELSSEGKKDKAMHEFIDAQVEALEEVLTKEGGAADEKTLIFDAAKIARKKVGYYPKGRTVSGENRARVATDIVRMKLKNHPKIKLHKDGDYILMDGL